MFSASVKHFVKSVGKDSFVPVQSLDIADNVNLLQIVVKKNKFWFWQSPSYTPTDFDLNDLLMDGETNKLEMPSKCRTLVSDYNPSYKIDVNGKFGADLCKELIHVEIDADDEIHLEVKFGNVEKTEVADIPKLLQALETKKLDLTHPMIEQLRKNKYKVLCLIVGMARLTKDGQLKSFLKFVNEEEVSTSVATGGARISVDDEKTKQFTIPTGTPIAYNVCELLITHSGQIQLIVIDGLHGGFGAKDDTDAPSSPTTDESPVLLFKGILRFSASEREDFTKTMFNILQTPRLIEPLLAQLKEAYRYINGARNSKSEISLSALKRSIVSKKEDWKQLLFMAGFVFKDDGKVEYPKAENDKLSSCRDLFKALVELDDDDIKALRSCDSSLAKPLCNLLRDAILKQPLKKSFERYSPIFAKDGPAQELLRETGFSLSGDICEPPQENVFVLQAMQRVIFALWGSAKM